MGKLMWVIRVMKREDRLAMIGSSTKPAFEKFMEDGLVIPVDQVLAVCDAYWEWIFGSEDSERDPLSYGSHITGEIPVVDKVVADKVAESNPRRSKRIKIQRQQP